MFKCEGKVTGLELQQLLARRTMPLKVSVVVGPSGSYREHDILNVFDEWLEPWGQAESGKLLS